MATIKRRMERLARVVRIMAHVSAARFAAGGVLVVDIAAAGPDIRRRSAGMQGIDTLAPGCGPTSGCRVRCPSIGRILARRQPTGDRRRSPSHAR